MGMKRRIAAVDRDLISQLPESAREALLSVGYVESCRKGHEIFGELETMEELCFLLEGYVSLYRNSYRGENRVIFICGAGEILNELVLENGKTSVAARALSDCKVLRITRQEMDSLIQQYPCLIEGVLRSLAQKTRRMYHKVGNDNGTYTLKVRLAAAIRKLARDYGVETERGIRVDFEVTVNLLSSMLGAKRETISRALSDMKKSGLIAHENGVLTVMDYPGLQQMITAIPVGKK